MKRPIAALLIIGIAAPAAWAFIESGMYPAREQPAFKASAPARRVSELEALPLLRELRDLNDLGIALKRKINAFIFRDRQAATAKWARKCLPASGGGFYARTTNVHGQDVTGVAGEIVNLSGAGHSSAHFTVNAYDKAGRLLGKGEARIEDFREHAVRPFRAVLPLPRKAVARVWVAFESGLAGKDGSGEAGGHYCFLSPRS